MKRTITALLLSIGVASAAESPSSLAGTVFWDEGGIVHLRLERWRRTIVFRSETEFIYVKVLTVSVFSRPRSWTVHAAPADGTYHYTKTGPSTGELTFSDPFLYGGPNPVPLKLNFVDGATDPVSSIPRGDIGRGTHDSFRGSFAISKLSTIHGQRVANVSTRGKVSADNPLTVGFVLQGDRQDVMIRVVGPSLRPFGVSQPWTNPRFQLYSAGSSVPRSSIAYYDDWSRIKEFTPALSKLFSYSGAFPFEVGSRDAVGVSPGMAPGGYTIVCEPDVDEPGGEALVEVYMIP